MSFGFGALPTSPLLHLKMGGVTRKILLENKFVNFGIYHFSKIYEFKGTAPRILGLGIEGMIWKPKSLAIQPKV
jgi:hypothetical protein